MTADLVAFLRARLDEDAVRATMRQWHDVDCDALPDRSSEYTYPCDCGVPERMLAEVDAKRRILDEYTLTEQQADSAEWPDEVDTGYVRGLEFAVRLLALPYADHPDYRPEWAPTP